MSEVPSLSLRARTRRAVQAELAEAAQTLILQRGYDLVTVDAIAAEVGLSKRSFFRYFDSKDDLVIGKYALFGDQMVEALDARPTVEDIWESLRRMLDPVVEYNDDSGRRRSAQEMQRIVHSTPVLHAGYLEKFDQMQDRLIHQVLQRLAAQGYDASEFIARTLTGAAFACLQAALRDQLDGSTASFGTTLDAAMALMRPAVTRTARPARTLHAVHRTAERARPPVATESQNL